MKTDDQVIKTDQHQNYELKLSIQWKKNNWQGKEKWCPSPLPCLSLPVKRPIYQTAIDHCVERYISIHHLRHTWSEKTTMAMATRGWRNKRFHELHNGLARLFYNFVRFLAVLDKTRTWNPLKVNPMTNYLRWLRTVSRIPMPSWRENLAP